MVVVVVVAVGGVVVVVVVVAAAAVPGRGSFVSQEHTWSLVEFGSLGSSLLQAKICANVE